MCVNCGDSSCSSCGNLRFPIGPPGAKGNTGAKGDTGDPGPAGPEVVMDLIRLNMAMSSPSTPIPIHSGNDFNVSASLILKPPAPVPPATYNLDNGTPCFSYDATTGVITVLKTGYYNIHAFMSLGAKLGSVWAPAVGAGYICLGLNVAGTNGDFFGTQMQNIVAGQNSKYIMLNLVSNGNRLVNGDGVRLIVFNRTTYAYNPATSSTGNFDITSLTVQRVR